MRAWTNQITFFTVVIEYLHVLITPSHTFYQNVTKNCLKHEHNIFQSQSQSIIGNNVNCMGMLIPITLSIKLYDTAMLGT